MYNLVSFNVKKKRKQKKTNRKILEYNLFIMHVFIINRETSEFFQLSPDDLNGGEMT